MTEDEAKEKWCPHVRIGDMAVNRYFDDLPSYSHCIGSDCMAWRWITTPEQAEQSDGMAKASGFCGLAGKP